MARRTIASIVIVVAASGCAGSIDESDQTEGLTPAQKLAQQSWLKQALPALKQGTCNTCHDGSMEPVAPGWMAGEKDLDIRDTVIAYVPSVVNLNSPKTSLVVLRGMHTGPAISAPAASAVITWLTYEQEARPAAMVIETPQTTATMCVGDPAQCTPNTIDLGAVGSTGSTISFKAMPIGADLYMFEMKVTAGPSGLKLVHPVFQTYPAGMTEAKPDSTDRYYNVALDLAAGGTATFGTVDYTTFDGFAAADPISIKFDTLSTKQ